MRTIFSIILATAWALPTHAHVGHLVPALGDGHWVGASAIGLAVVVGVWGLLKGKANPGDRDAAPADDAELEEQEA